MCKLVGVIGKIPQYEFCEEYKEGLRKEELWRDRVEQAQLEYDHAKALRDKLIMEHCPLDVGDVVDGIRIKNSNGTPENPCYKCLDSGTDRCNPKQCNVANPDILRKRKERTTKTVCDQCKDFPQNGYAKDYPADKVKVGDYGIYCGKCGRHLSAYGREK